MTKRKWASLAAVAVILSACAQRPSAPLDDAGKSSDPAAEVLKRIGSPRLDTLSADGGVASVGGRASDGEADLTRTLWYENIAAAAFAQLVAVDVATRSVSDYAGNVLGTEQDPVSAASQDAFAPTNDTVDGIAVVIAPGAEKLGVKVVSIQYVDLFGGIAEVVVQPSDVESFVASAGLNVPILLDRLAQDQRPYLLTVVDANQVPQFVLGYTPGVGGDGQGLAWVTPGLKTDAIWGIPVTTG